MRDRGTECAAEVGHAVHCDLARTALEFLHTETALMGDIDAGEAFARGLAELGCSLALDDFGTGFGSFTYLKKLPIKYLKIDIDLVRELGSNRANQHLVTTIVGLARDSATRRLPKASRTTKRWRC